jgi:predicted molibdopterin-dependent oxidoreductase YjgC
MSELSLSIDGRQVTVEEGSSILDACRHAAIDTPTLCYTETLDPAYACRACVVEVGSGPLIPACARQAEEGMEVSTASERVEQSRRMVFELLGSATTLARADADIRRWAEELGADPSRFGTPAGSSERVAPHAGHHTPATVGTAATVGEPAKIEDDLYVRDYSACILCFRCVDACGEQHQNTFAIVAAGRGFGAHISTEFDASLPDSACVYCGNCITVCPTGALVGKIQWDLRAAGDWDPSRQETKRSVCAYCGVGCNLEITTQDGRIVEVASPAAHDVTLGNLCIKGRFGWQFVYADE